MINVDFNFGSVPSTVDSPDDELETLKNSPSHQSDSGMSMGSDSDSVNISAFEMFNDAELMGYLSSGSRTSSPETVAVESVLDCAINNGASNRDLTPNNGKLEIEKHVQILKERKSNVTLRKLDASTTTPVKSKLQPQIKKVLPMPEPTVKVVKVVSASHNIDSDGEIVEALTRRNQKNAVQAKINREKKKIFIKNLEDTVKELRFENDNLKQNQTRMEECQRILEDEVHYLKSVLANQSALSSLLQNIPNVQNVTLSTSFNRRKRGANDDHDYVEQPVNAKRAKRNSSKAGVCLHVDNGHASLEFCSHCSENAKLTDDL
ncbi:uncharacterized protein LOC132557585 isoform X2 [Ylistrum balloti]|nr:uncharacterized protein LOC132557585 isoform X2 [Ylistrum balloti]